MPRFKARTLAVIQRNVEETLTDVCMIEREDRSIGVMGEPLGGWVAVAEGVPCRVISVGRGASGSAYRVVGGQEAMVERYRLVCPVGTAFGINDRVTLSGGETFIIVDMVNGWTDSVMVGAVMVRAKTS